jgi:hypothetical protein
VFCNYVCSVMGVLGQEYNPDQWRLFIVSSKASLKVVLHRNGNRFPSVPLAHTANMTESYESMKLLLGRIQYDEFKRKLCCDLEVVALLASRTRRNTSFSWYSCGTVSELILVRKQIKIYPATVGVGLQR